MVGKVEAPAKANMIDAKAFADPITVGSGYFVSFSFSMFVASMRLCIIMRTQANTVVNNAPTATGQKSFGVPSQVRGMSNATTIIIQMQRDKWSPTPASSTNAFSS